MRIVVVSDTHRDFNGLYDLVEKQKAGTDLFLHLGDGEREVEDLLALMPGLPLRFVRGNCDLASLSPETDLVQAEKVRILMTHGHLYGVKYSLKKLADEARALHASVALFGHTHCPCYHFEDGLHILNPGSLSAPRGSERGFGVIEVHGSQVLCSLAQA